jgi:hypothetical protein
MAKMLHICSDLIRLPPSWTSGSALHKDLDRNLSDTPGGKAAMAAPVQGS